MTRPVEAQPRVSRTLCWALDLAPSGLAPTPVLAQKRAPDGTKVWLLTGGQRQHHGYRDQALYLANALQDTGQFEVIIREDAALLETPALRKYDILIVNTDRRDPEFKLTQSQQEALLNDVKSGHACVSIHGTDNAAPSGFPGGARCSTATTPTSVCSTRRPRKGPSPSSPPHHPSLSQLVIQGVDRVVEGRYPRYGAGATSKSWEFSFFGKNGQSTRNRRTHPAVSTILS